MTIPTQAVVLSCIGAHEADLNVVRSLGTREIPVIVISEYNENLSQFSKYCNKLIVLQKYFNQDPEQILFELTKIYSELGVKPVIFPTADPDLHALIQISDKIKNIAVSTVIEPQISSLFLNKYLFYNLAEQLQLPIPKTIHLKDDDTPQQIKLITDSLTFPIIFKPAHPTGWQDPALPFEIANAKALQIDKAEDLLAIIQQLNPCLAKTLVQEFIPGEDDEHYDVHVYIGRNGQVQASYSGRKIRIFPPHAGSGCYVESIANKELEEQAIEMLQRIKYRGFANINYKRHAHTGKYMLLEINPRVSQWSILATRSGVNLPVYAYHDALGLLEPALQKRDYNIRYINEINDLKAFKTYRKEGRLSYFSYINSWLRHPLVLQFCQWNDLGPCKSMIRQAIARRLGRKKNG